MYHVTFKPTTFFSTIENSILGLGPLWGVILFYFHSSHQYNFKVEALTVSYVDFSIFSTFCVLGIFIYIYIYIYLFIYLWQSDNNQIQYEKPPWDRPPNISKQFGACDVCGSSFTGSQIMFSHSLLMHHRKGGGPSAAYPVAGPKQ